MITASQSKSLTAFPMSALQRGGESCWFRIAWDVAEVAIPYALCGITSKVRPGCSHHWSYKCSTNYGGAIPALFNVWATGVHYNMEGGNLSLLVLFELHFGGLGRRRLDKWGPLIDQLFIGSLPCLLRGLPSYIVCHFIFLQGTWIEWLSFAALAGQRYLHQLVLIRENQFQVARYGHLLDFPLSSEVRRQTLTWRVVVAIFKF